MNRWGTWVIFSHLKADPLWFGKNNFEDSNLGAQLQSCSRSCWIPPKLSCACPCWWPTAAAAAALRWVVPGVFFTSWTLMVKDAAQRVPEWFPVTHTCFNVCAFLWYRDTCLGASLTSHLSDSAAQDSQWLWKGRMRSEWTNYDRIIFRNKENVQCCSDNSN